MRCLVLVALLLVGCGRVDADLASDGSPPPLRFQNDTAATISTMSPEQVDRWCGLLAGRELYPPGSTFLACHYAGTIYVPNPCGFPDEQFAQIACHELAHRQGWTAMHER